MKPTLRPFQKPTKFSDLPDGTYYEAGHLVTKNAGWRTVRPVISLEKCIGCLQCYLYCPDGVIYKTLKTENGAKVAVDYDFCKGCAICVKTCKVNAIEMEAER